MTQGLPPGAGDELGPGARALLDAARDGLSPDAAAVRRVHARIQLATAGGAAAGAALGVKLGAIAVVAAVLAGAAIYATRGASVPAAAPSVAVAPAPASAPAPAVAVATPARAAAASDDDEQITIETPQRPVARIAPAAAPHRAPNPAAAAPRAAPPAGSNPAAAAPSTGIALGREVELIDLAMTALRRGDSPGALRVVRAYTAEAAGAGQLGQDAAAIEIEALCKLADPAARDKLAAFDVRFPRSAQRPRLAAACR